MCGCGTVRLDETRIESDMTTASQTARRRCFATLTAALVATAAGVGMWMPGAATAATTGSGKPATETRDVGTFEAIALHGSFRLEVRQAAKEAVNVTADDNLLPMVETVVESGSQGRTLVIRPKRGESWRTKTEMKVSVDVVRLSALSSAGSGHIVVEGLKTPLFKLSIAGASDAALRALDAESLQISIAGSGDVKAAGQAKKLRLSIAGSGDASLADLVADEVSVSIAGSGDAQVTANKSLAATVAGSGDVRYRGNPTDVKSTVMGSGTIRKQ